MTSVPLKAAVAIIATSITATLTASATVADDGDSARRAVPGTYKMKKSKGQLSFKVTRNGKYMKHWKALLLTRCGVYPSPITYAWQWYNFPTTKIKRSGWVKRKWKKDNFSMKMRVKFVGRRAKKGYTLYSGPGPCVAVKKWTARRVGK